MEIFERKEKKSSVIVSKKQQYVLNILEDDKGLKFEGFDQQDLINFIGENWKFYQEGRQIRRQQYKQSRGYSDRDNMNHAEEAMEDYLMMEYCGGGHD